MYAPRALGFVPSAVFRLYRGDNRIQDCSAKNHPLFGLGSSFGEQQDFNVRNTGSREGVEIAEVYAALPADSGEPPKRLVGWSRIELKPGESKQVSVTIPIEYLSVFDESAEIWKRLPGNYLFLVGSSSRNLPLHGKLMLN
jgi:beta-glucosidase